MCNANGNSLDLKFLGIDVTIAFFVLVAGAKEVCSLVMIESEDFKVVNTSIKGNDNVADLCGVLLADHHVITGMNSCIDHRFALCDQRKELSLAHQGFGQG